MSDIQKPVVIVTGTVKGQKDDLCGLIGCSPFALLISGERL